MAVPALVWAMGAARRRRDLGLAFIVIAFAAAWLPWARIDRVTFQYHYFSALPFAVLALGALTGELWSRRPSSFAFLTAKLGAAVAVCLPALLWAARGPLCAISGASGVKASETVCGPAANVSPPLFLLAIGALALLITAAWVPAKASVRTTLLVAGSLVLALVAVVAPHETGFIPALAALVISGLLASFVLAVREPRRLAAGILAAAGVAALVFYPFVASIAMPETLLDLWRKFLPTYDYFFQFASDTAASPPGPGLAIMAVIITLVALNVVGIVRIARSRE
jgi:hypothetical protein